MSLTATGASFAASNNGVLIVVDDADMRDTLKEQLADLGYGPVSEAISIGQSVEHFQREKFELVVVDLDLGLQDAIRLISIIRRAPLPHVKAMPIIATATTSDSTRIQSAFAAGVDGFLAKPFSALNLRRQIQFAMSKVAARSKAG